MSFEIELKKEDLEIFETLVSLESVIDKDNNVKPSKSAFEKVKEIFESVGLEVKLYENNGYYFLHMSGDLEVTNELLFISHLDVVPPGPGWTRPPFKLTLDETGKIAFGRGVLDNKGGIFSLYLLMRNISEKQGSLLKKVGVFVAGDEEIGGSNTSSFFSQQLKKENKLPSMVINTDGLQPDVFNKRRGPYVLKLTFPKKISRIQGKRILSEHVSESRNRANSHAAYFMYGSDRHALIDAAANVYVNNLKVKFLDGLFVKNNVIPSKVTLDLVVEDETGMVMTWDENLTKFLQVLPGLCKISFSDIPSLYGTTITPNIVSEQADKWTFTIDIRTMEQDRETILNKLKRYLDEYSFECEMELLGGDVLYTPPNHPLVKEILEIFKSLGINKRLNEGAGATDSRFFSRYGVPAIDVGMDGSSPHGPDEHVKLDSIILNANVYFKFIKRHFA